MRGDVEHEARSRCWCACTRTAWWATYLARLGAIATRSFGARLEMIADEGRGALIYLHQTSKGFSVERVNDRPTLTFHRDVREPHIPSISAKPSAKSASAHRFSRT